MTLKTIDKIDWLNRKSIEVNREKSHGQWKFYYWSLSALKFPCVSVVNIVKELAIVSGTLVYY